VLAEHARWAQGELAARAAGRGGIDVVATVGERQVAAP